MAIRRTLLATGAALLGCALGPSGALAVIGGDYDGGAHPNVGIVLGADKNHRGVFSCTGTLVDPTTVLTAAHCTDAAVIAGDPGADDDVVEIVVSFKPMFDRNAQGVYLIVPNIAAVPDPNPAYVDIPSSQGAGGTAAFLRTQADDVGLLHLTEPAAVKFPGIQPRAI